MKTGRFVSAIMIVLVAFIVAYCNGDILSTEADDSTMIDVKMRGIWILGGTGKVAGSTMISQIDLYDPVTHTWYPDIAADASGSYTPTAFGMAASVSGKIYVIGGAISSTSTTSAVFEYNISTNSWRTMTSLPANLMDAVVYVNDGKIYVMGGTSTVYSSGATTAHYVFDPAGSGGNGSWTVLAVYTTARSAMAGCNYNGLVSFAGGRSGTTIYNTNDIYVINSNTYAAGTETVIPSVRAGMAYAGYSGDNGTYFFLIGGASSFPSSTYYFSLATITFVTQASSFCVYTPPATSYGWYYGTSHPAFSGGTATGIVFARAAVSPYDGDTSEKPTLYVFGGLQNSPTGTVSNELYSIDASAETVAATGVGTYVDDGWTTRSVMPRARYGHSAVVINQ